MNISVTRQLEDYIQHKVGTGMYHSASEVVRDALRIMQERDALQAAKLEALKHDISKGLDSLEQGHGRALDIESIKRRGRATLNLNHD